MVSNIASSLRSIVRKNLPEDYKVKTGLKDAANEHFITTVLSVLFSLPLVLYYENYNVIQASYNMIEDKNIFLFNIFVCGLSWYLYNEMQNIVLSSLGPVPTAVGNTLKRVVIFVALYVSIPGETFPIPKIIGCGIAIVGCLFYAIFDSMKM